MTELLMPRPTTLAGHPPQTAAATVENRWSGAEENFELLADYGQLCKLGSTGSAYHRPRTWMGSAGRPCADDIGGPQPLNGHLYNLIIAGDT